MMGLESYVINSVIVIFLLIALGLTTLTLPGNLVIVLIAAGYGLYDGFVHFDYFFLALLITAFAFGELVEFVAGAVGAKKEKASKRAIAAAVFGAIAGGLAGTALLPVLGSFIGAMLGAYAASYYAELSVCRDKEQSKRVAFSVMKGQMIGMIVKFGIAVTMVIAIILKLQW
jgi:uncharacterized protein YqgC (DUF456 family)